MTAKMSTLAIAGILMSRPMCAIDLRDDTLAAFQAHIAAADKRLEPRFRGENFLVATMPSPLRAKLRGGAIVVNPGSGNGNVEIKGGLIQDWTGSMFIAGATVAKAVGVLQDYVHHKEFFKPEVADCLVRSQNRSSNGGVDFQVYMRLVKSKLVLTDVLNTEHQIHFSTLDDKRTYIRGISTRIAEVTDAGKSSERELPVGKDRGFLWRMNGYWLFEEADGGVYVESESITLTRDMPFGMGKLFGPILRSLPAESIRNGLERTRAAVLAREPAKASQ